MWRRVPGSVRTETQNAPLASSGELICAHHSVAIVTAQMCQSVKRCTRMQARPVPLTVCDRAGWAGVAPHIGVGRAEGSSGSWTDGRKDEWE
eukprot:12823409-Alexandrium_andersonii.AAC.1